MDLFISEYKKLLIIQYANKPKANKHIEAIISKFSEIYDLLNSFDRAFDVDLAIGKQLDIIGKIVGVSRIVPFSVPKKYFGFRDNPSAYPMGDKFDDGVVSHTFKDKFEIPYATSELDDTDYRFFIKAKITKNYAKATMIDSNHFSVQNAVDYLFDGLAYVTDMRNMVMGVYMDKTFTYNMIQYIKQLDLVPRPQGVGSVFISYDSRGTFGFNPHNTGFGDKFDDKIDSYFANKII